MNASKSHNSILILTTLGVYLGLVLVGATPQVLAQAAMTRQFNVKDEAGRKDELEKKPDGNESPLNQSVYVYLEDLDSYLAEVRKIDEQLHSVYQRNPEFVIPAPCHQIGDSNRPFNVEVTGRTVLPILLDRYYIDKNWDWDVGCKPLKNSNSENLHFAAIQVSRTQKGVFTYHIAIKLASSGEASALFENLKRVFKLVDATDLSNRQKVLWKNTKLTTTDDQVLITTRLPRGSLDELLAKDAK